MSGNFFVKAGYKCNHVSEHGSGAESALEKADFYQSAVYEFAAKKIAENNCRSVLDVGCGFGAKLAEFVEPVCSDIAGIDFSQKAIDYNKKNLGFGKWLLVDLNNPKVGLAKNFDLVVCADVLEHLSNPDRLLAFVKRFSNKGSFFVFSTPERDLIAGKNSFGPPGNRFHVREWNFSEFENYIK